MSAYRRDLDETKNAFLIKDYNLLGKYNEIGAKSARLLRKDLKNI